jgi:hypothetical protein
MYSIYVYRYNIAYVFRVQTSEIFREIKSINNAGGRFVWICYWYMYMCVRDDGGIMPKPQAVIGYLYRAGGAVQIFSKKVKIQFGGGLFSLPPIPTHTSRALYIALNVYQTSMSG